jgi:hypothetical protein
MGAGPCSTRSIATRWVPRVVQDVLRAGAWQGHGRIHCGEQIPCCSSNPLKMAHSLSLSLSLSLCVAGRRVASGGGMLPAPISHTCC